MVKQKTTTIQPLILQYLLRFRFLTSIKIQKLLQLNSLHSTNYYLIKLIRQQLIGSLYSRTKEQSFQPAIYYLKSASIKQLNITDKKIIKRIYKEKSKSKTFIDHSILIADYYIFLNNDSIKTKQTLNFFTKSDLLPHNYLIHPLPDAYFSRVDKKENIKRYFLEIIDENSPRFSIRKRIDQYNNYIENKTFEKATGYKFPTILFICPNQTINNYLKKYFEKIWDESNFDEISIHSATKEDAFNGSWHNLKPEE